MSSTAPTDPGTRARSWLLQATSGTLCTLAARAGIEGHPYGSVVPFATTARGEPVVLLAHIAAHTANLHCDPRCSLFVQQPDLRGDPQAGWRISLVGQMERLVGESAPADPRPADVAISEAELEDLDARYLERVPAATDYRRQHNFSFWRLQIEQARGIAGFGVMGWLSGDQLLRDPGGEGLADAAPGAIAHMNEDHAQNMVEMCTGMYGFTPGSVAMHAIDRTGFGLVTQDPGRRLHLSFGREITADELRGAVIDVLRRAREAPAR